LIKDISKKYNINIITRKQNEIGVRLLYFNRGRYYNYDKVEYSIKSFGYSEAHFRHAPQKEKRLKLMLKTNNAAFLFDERLEYGFLTPKTLIEGPKGSFFPGKEKTYLPILADISEKWLFGLINRELLKTQHKEYKKPNPEMFISL